MNFNPISNLQLPLFVYGEPTANLVDVLPAVWSATESLASPEAISRHRGMDALVELGAQRASPLVAYMLATCLTDTDIYIRRRAAYIVADLINHDPSMNQTSEEVRRAASTYLHNMREETIFGLLEVALLDPLVEKSIYYLFNECPVAGSYLGNILSQYKNPVPIRQKAIYYVGTVGYTEALPVLERLLARLEARSTGQYSMSFAPSVTKTDDEIIPFLRIAIHQLSSR